MIEIGTVKTVNPAQGTILVEFAQLDTEATCSVLVPTTGSNAVFFLPAQGTQVVCWLESGKNLALGCVFSEADPVPDDVDANTEIRQFGKTILTAKDNLYKVEQDKIKLEFTGNKASLKNDSTGLKTILKDLFSLLKTFKSSNAGGAALPMPPTIQKIVQLEQKTEQLFND